jgi:Integrase core domain
VGNVRGDDKSDRGSRQIIEAFPWDSSPRYLIRDRDTAYGVVFRQRLRAMGIRDKPTAPQSPWQNPYVERLIGTIRRECLDHMIVFGEAHLRRILGRYAAYYNESRIHRSLDKDAPFHRAIEPSASSHHSLSSAAFFRFALLAFPNPRGRAAKLRHPVCVCRRRRRTSRRQPLTTLQLLP